MPSFALSNTPPRSSAVLWRAFWLVMLIAHLPGLISAVAGFGSAEGQAARAVLFTFAHAFFLLKLCDVAWLRVRADRKTFLAITLAFTLLHAGVLPHPQAAASGEYQPWQAASIVLASGSMLVLARQPTATSAVASTAPRPWLSLLTYLRQTVDAFFPPRLLLRARAIQTNRAPPF